MIYPAPYHNPVMRSGEWKLWLETVLNSIRNIGVTAAYTRSSGTQVLGSSWTELFEKVVTSDEKKAALSVSLGGYNPLSGNVVLHLRFDGGGFLDETTRHTFTAYGTAAESPTDAKFSSSGYFNTKNDYIDCTDNLSDFWFKEDVPFVIKFWYYRYGTDDTATIFRVANLGTVDDEFINILITSGGTIEVSRRGGHYVSSAAGATTVYTWHFIEINRDSSNVMRIFVDGEQSGTTPTWDIDWGSNDYDIALIGNNGSSGKSQCRLDEFVIINGEEGNTSNYIPPAFPFPSEGGGTPVNLRLLINGSVVESVDYPSIARHYFDLDELNEGDVISVEANYAQDVSVNWWYTYEASTSGIESGGRVKYPAPEYANADPRWISRWTSIYRLLRALEGDTPGRQKSVESDEVSTNAYSYIASSTDIINTVVVKTNSQDVRIECFSRSLFAGFELHKDGSKIADLSMIEQRGEDAGNTQSSLCHDIVVNAVSAGTHTFTLKGVATTTESGHMEAQLHVIY